MKILYGPSARAVLSCCACVFFPEAFAEESLDAERARTLDTIVVTAAPISPLTWVTDPRLPRQPVPASDGADYLKTVPGFSAIRNGGTNGDPVLRGMFGSRLNVLSNDGVLIGACPARMDNALSYISPETFDRLTIIKGPQSVQWGAGASAGTIRFERDTPHFNAPTVQGHASALAGSRNRNDQVLEVTGGNRNGYLRVAGNRSESDDYRDGNGDVVPSRWRKWNSDVALGWTPDADTVLEVSAGTGDALARYAGRSMDGARFRRTSFGARFEKKNLPGALESINASVYYNNADHVMDNYTLRTPNASSSMSMPMASNIDRRTIGGRVAGEWRWDEIQIIAGVDAQSSRHRARTASGRGTYRQLPWTVDARTQNLGAFTELTLGAHTASRWISGLRIDHARAKDVRATSATARQTRTENLGSGFFRYEGDFNRALTWYAGLGYSSRMPDYWELFSANRGPVGSLNAFSALAPEKTSQLDVGMQYRGLALDAWVSAYAGRITDYIIFDYLQGGMMGATTRARNVDARIAGGEAGIEWRPLDGWSFGATLAYAWGENRTDGTALPQMPPLDSRFTVNWQGRRWSAGVLLRAVAGQGRVAVNEGNVVGRDLGKSVGFSTLAINTAFQVSDALQLSAGVDNVFDRAYSEHLNLAGSADFGFPADPVRINEPGRTFWFKANVLF